jgi:hypothetical protein
MTEMSEVTYYVALPFVAADDGIAPAEAVDCFNPNAAVMRAEALLTNARFAPDAVIDNHSTKPIPLQLTNICQESIRSPTKEMLNLF